MACTRENVVIFLTALGIGIPILLISIGLDSLKSGRNTGTVGSIESFQQSGFSDCFATVNYSSIGFNNTKSVYVPCDSFLNVSSLVGLPIYLCYNRWHPENVAYDDRGQHASKDYNPWKKCSSIGYDSAKAGVIAGSVILIVVAVSWLAYLSYLLVPCPNGGFKRFNGPDTQPVVVQQATSLSSLHPFDRESMNKA